MQKVETVTKFRDIPIDKDSDILTHPPSKRQKTHTQVRVFTDVDMFNAATPVPEDSESKMSVDTELSVVPNTILDFLVSKKV